MTALIRLGEKGNNGWGIGNQIAKIFGIDDVVKSNMHEYNNIMTYMTYYNLNLLDLALMPQEMYLEQKKKVRQAGTNYIFNMLEACRVIIQNNLTGNKTIRYLLYTMRINLTTLLFN